MRLPTSIVCSSVEGRVAFALQGHGIAYIADFVVREELASGQLVAVLTGFTVEAGELTLLWPSGRHVVPRVRAFIDFMSAQAMLDP